MTITISDLPDGVMRNSRDPVASDCAPRCQSQWMLSLHIDGKVDIFCRDYYGGDGSPSDEWHYRTLTWGFGQCGDLSTFDADAIASYLQPGGRLYSLLARVHAGHSVDWDGSNHVGDLTDDAVDASEQIDLLLSSDHFETRTHIPIWDACEWLTAGGDNDPAEVLSDLGITVDATLDEIIAATHLAELLAKKDGCEITGARDAIHALIDDVKSKMADDDDEDEEDADQ